MSISKIIETILMQIKCAKRYETFFYIHVSLTVAYFHNDIYNVDVIANVKKIRHKRIHGCLPKRVLVSVDYSLAVHLILLNGTLPNPIHVIADFLKLTR